MRDKVMKHREENGRIPDIGIAFCGDRAVITIRSFKDKIPRNHNSISYGFLFWLRLCFGIMSVWRNINQDPSPCEVKQG